jgi:hypothetical protein
MKKILTALFALALFSSLAQAEPVNSPTMTVKVVADAPPPPAAARGCGSGGC